MIELSDWSLELVFAKSVTCISYPMVKFFLTFTGAFDLFCNFVLNLECLN